MKKMPCLFERTFHGRNSATLLESVTPGCEWVLAGEGVASIKRDGTACLVRDGQLYKRYDAKKDPRTGAYRMPPEGAIPCDEPDPVTGHWPHWVRVDPMHPADRWHSEAWARQGAELVDGTYELCGPKISANPEGFVEHTFIRHGVEVVEVERSFAALGSFLFGFFYEGLVFAHPDGRMAKVRRKDFGYSWPVKQVAA